MNPQEFTTKSYHLVDTAKNRKGFYASDPEPHLPNVVTGSQCILLMGRNNVPKTGSTGAIPPELGAFMQIDGRLVPCNTMYFIWDDGRHFPGTREYFDIKAKCSQAAAARTLAG